MLAGSSHLFFSANVFRCKLSTSQGGCMISWKRSYTMLNSWVTRRSLSVFLRQLSSGEMMIVMTVYGPSQDDKKQPFLLERWRSNMLKSNNVMEPKLICINDINSIMILSNLNCSKPDPLDATSQNAQPDLWSELSWTKHNSICCQHDNPIGIEFLT